jgi:soluble lytic murein transglycosylase-like protein
VKVRFFVLFCLVVLLSALLPVTAFADQKATDQTEEKQKDPKVSLVEEIIDDHEVAIKHESTETGVPASVIVAMIAAESSNNPEAVSKAGARGLMQTLPEADKTTGIKCDGKNPSCQIKKGVAFVQYLIEHEGIPKWSRIFLAYNEGPTGSRRFKTPEVLGHIHVKKCTEYLRIAQAVLAHKI